MECTDPGYLYRYRLLFSIAGLVGIITVASYAIVINEGQHPVGQMRVYVCRQCSCWRPDTAGRVRDISKEQFPIRTGIEQMSIVSRPVF